MMNWYHLQPEIIIAITMAVLLVLDLMVKSGQRKWLSVTALLGTVLALASLWWAPLGGFQQAFVLDGIGRYIKAIILGTAALVILCAWDFDLVWKRPLGEFFVLLLASTLGMLFLASGTELVLLYVGLELATFPLVLLTAYCPQDARSAEGGLKYLILAALGSAVFIFGFSLVYAITGATTLDVLRETVAACFDSPVVLTGLLLMLAGLGFKIGLVPFHMWVPDAYEGAPTPVTMFMSVAGKTAGLILAVRILAGAFSAVQETWGSFLAVLSAATMLLGNFAAIPQKNIKRMLAYSAIAQAGYLIMGLVAFEVMGISSMLYYLAAYLFTNLAVFAVVIAVERHTGSCDISAFNGLAQVSPQLGLIMMLALLSLAGIPPLAGFTAKFYLFAAVYGQGFVWLVVLAVLNSALSLYYYLRVVRAVYITPPAANAAGPWEVPAPLAIVLAVTVIGILLLGIYPGPFVEMARIAAAFVL
ncbi:NADH-quinone oxidoreductase subunit N [bacterium]|nr:NADH-quinone oxidoreductase subunit N [bacterium]